MSAAPPSSPHRVAVVGAGPAGFYAAEALLRAGQGLAVDVFERLPFPFGLVRYGVAPDHPKLKQVTAVFERIADLPGFRFFGNVRLGVDVAIADLRECYHAVILCCGAERDRPLAVPGAGLAGVIGGMEFVGWYNSHPDRADLAPDLSGRNAVVIGMGNVALDVARLLAKRPDELAATDIADHALAALRQSKIDRITVAARGGPAGARCTDKELREFNTLNHCHAHADDGHYAVPPVRGVPAIFQEMPHSAAPAVRNCHFAFGMKPLAIIGEDRVRAVRFARSGIRDGEIATGEAPEVVEIAADIVITCIGSLPTQVPGVDLPAGASTVPNVGGRVTSEDGSVITGLYASGWIKRGASGTIGTNRACSVATIEALLQDLPSLPTPRSNKELIASMEDKVTFENWRSIDERELRLGAVKQKTRDKIIKIIPKDHNF